MKNFKLLFFIGKLLVFLAAAVFPIYCRICRLWYYQPEEPEGFESFKFNA